MTYAQKIILLVGHVNEKFSDKAKHRIKRTLLHHIPHAIKVGIPIAAPALLYAMQKSHQKEFARNFGNPPYTTKYRGWSSDDLWQDAPNIEIP